VAHGRLGVERRSGSWVVDARSTPSSRVGKSWELGSQWEIGTALLYLPRPKPAVGGFPCVSSQCERSDRTPHWVRGDVWRSADDMQADGLLRSGARRRALAASRGRGAFSLRVSALQHRIAKHASERRRTWQHLSGVRPGLPNCSSSTVHAVSIRVDRGRRHGRILSGQASILPFSPRRPMTSNCCPPSMTHPRRLHSLRNRPARCRVVCPAGCFFAIRAFDEPGESAAAVLEGCLMPQTHCFGWATGIFLGFHRGCACDWLRSRVGGGVRGVNRLQRTQRRLYTTRQAPPAAVARCSPVHPRSNSIIAPLTGGPREELLVARRRGCAEPAPDSINQRCCCRRAGCCTL
jgi:hypothetical protein